MYFNNSLRETIQEEDKAYMAVPWPELAKPVVTSTNKDKLSVIGVVSIKQASALACEQWGWGDSGDIL